LLLGAENIARGTFGDIPAGAADEPLPFAADTQHGEVAVTDRSAQHREDALLLAAVYVETVCGRGASETAAAGERGVAGRLPDAFVRCASIVVVGRSVPSRSVPSR
jgi:hypothetical protein